MNANVILYGSDTAPSIKVANKGNNEFFKTKTSLDAEVSGGSAVSLEFSKVFFLNATVETSENSEKVGGYIVSSTKARRKLGIETNNIDVEAAWQSTLADLYDILGYKYKYLAIENTPYEADLWTSTNCLNIAIESNSDTNNGNGSKYVSLTVVAC